MLNLALGVLVTVVHRELRRRKVQSTTSENTLLKQACHLFFALMQFDNIIMRD